MKKKINCVAPLQLPKTSWGSAPLRSSPKKVFAAPLRSAPVQNNFLELHSAPNEKKIAQITLTCITGPTLMSRMTEQLVEKSLILFSFHWLSPLKKIKKLLHTISIYLELLLARSGFSLLLIVFIIYRKFQLIINTNYVCGDLFYEYV